MLLFRLCKILWLGLVLLALLGLRYLSSPAPAPPAADGYHPADPAPAPVAVPAPAVRLAYYRQFLDLYAGATSAAPDLGRKALPRSRWHLVPCSVLPRPLDAPAARAAQLHKV